MEEQTMRKKLRNIGTALRKIALKIQTWILAISIILSAPRIAFAANVGDSVLATGTKALVSDLTTWLMILAPTVTVLLVVYYLIRKSASDEMDSKKWNSRITVALISCIGAVLASAIVSLLIGYYQ
jgi:ABC-type molybdate transport system permease subunit